jgi:hypothetical protein
MPMPSGKRRMRLADGAWLVDWRVIERIERAHFRAAYRYAMRHRKLIENGFGMPEIYTLEVDFDAVNARAERAVSSALSLLTRQASGNLGGSELRQHLTGIQMGTNKFSDQFLDDLKEVSKGNMERTNSRDAFYGKLKWGAEKVRDLSAEVIIIVGSATLAGGATLSGAVAGLLGVGSALKGIGKFQDTASRDSALLEATSSFAFALVPGGKQAAAAKRALLFASKVVIGTAQGLVESRDARTPADKRNLTEVLTKAVGEAMIEAGAGALVSAQPVEKMLRKTTIPVSVLVRKRLEVGKALVEKTAEDVSQHPAKLGLDHGLEHVHEKLIHAATHPAYDAYTTHAAHPNRSSGSFKNLVAFGSRVTFTIVDEAIEPVPAAAGSGSR